MNARGFTLIEVILVVLVLALAIPGLLMVVDVTTESQVNAVGTTTAVELAREEMEALIAKKRSDCGTCGYSGVPAGLGTFAAVPGYPNYERKTDVELLDSDLNPTGSDAGYKKITVTVRAVGVGPSVPDAVLVTLITDVEG